MTMALRKHLTLSRLSRLKHYSTKIATSKEHSTSFLPSPPSTPKVDFAHHKAGVARLNHASFGAVPLPVQQAQDKFRQMWLEQPDEWYFSGMLESELRKAAQFASRTLSPMPIPSDQICLIENATVATCCVAYHWSKLIQTDDVVIYLDIAYKACKHILQEYCGGSRGGAQFVPIQIPFLAKGRDEILDSVENQLRHLAEKNRRPRFAFLDHVSSQPSMLLPIQELIRLVRQYGSDDMEVCVDGAHAIGSVTNMDVLEWEGCDYYYSNLHKWAFAPSTATIFWSPHLPNLRHVIVSWAWGRGLQEEVLFPGTRDFSSLLAVPAAVEYLEQWRSNEDGKNCHDYCHSKVLEAAAKLRSDWGVDNNSNQPNGEMEEALVATQAMVRLPSELIVTDVPGQITRGVRDVLRQDYGVEAAIGNFGPDRGSFVRLSYAIYNTSDDVQKLSNAIIDIIEKQRKGTGHNY